MIIGEEIYDRDPDVLGDGDDVDELHFTDVGNAKRLILAHGARFRYVAAWGAWHVYDGRRWKRDSKGEIVEAAKDVARSLWAEVAAAAGTVDKAADAGMSEVAEIASRTRKALAAWASKSESANRIDAMVKLARTSPEVAVEPADLDPDPWLFNVANGTIDLRTGRLRAHRPQDMITKLSPVVYRPGAPCPEWVAFLERVIPDPEVRLFLQEVVGYAMVAVITEHILVFGYGVGANGKTTMLQALLTMSGDYGRQAEPDLLMARREAHPTGMADLMGARLVVSTEVDEGRRLAEATVKQLTGADRIKARFMRQDFFEFEPTHTLFLAANHRPVVRGTDHAIWRRLRLLPFTVTIPPEDQDHHLVDKLRAEMPGILAWAVEGCLRWQKSGLSMPKAVMAATEDYRVDMDVLGAYLDECCVVSEVAYVSSENLYRSYVEWCDANGEHALSQRRLGPALVERGFERRKHGAQRRWHWFGVGLLEPMNPTDPQLGLNATCARA